jgi:adenosylcobinamide-GDP ribazoletransferase
MALILVLLCKWTAITTLVAAGTAANLVWIPVLARAQLLLLLLTTPYARSKGMGVEVRDHLARAAAWAGLALSLVASTAFLGLAVLALVLAAGILFLLWRRSMMARLGGFTGDTAGTLVELSEMLMLTVAALFL